MDKSMSTLISYLKLEVTIFVTRQRTPQNKENVTRGNEAHSS